MKRPIDPNLNNSDDDILLNLTGGNSKQSEGLSFAEGSEPDDVKTPEYTVSVDDEKNGTIPVTPMASVENINGDISAIVDKEEAPHSSHHHHSHSSHSGEHHHSSDGHHHSSSHHHHSSGSHHSGSHHHSHHRHGKKKKGLPTAAKIAIIVLVILLLIPIIAMIVLGINVKTGDFKKENAAATEYSEVIEYNGHKYKYNENVVSIAFMGIDQDTLKTSDQTDFVGASDADIVFAVDTQSGKASAIAIPRDTMVDVDMYMESGTLIETQKTQLCLAYAYGDGRELSCKNTVNSISRVLYNVPINKYFALDLDGIAALNDAIGGVTIDSSLYDFKDEGIKVGDKVVLKGDMAEKYVRQRNMDTVDASINRTDRQVQYVKAYTKQLAPAVMNDFSVISKLYNEAQKYSQSDIKLDNVTYLGSLLLSKGITDFESYRLKGTFGESADPLLPDVAHAEFTPDEDYLMQTILKVFYTQLD